MKPKGTSKCNPQAEENLQQREEKNILIIFKTMFMKSLKYRQIKGRAVGPITK